MAKYLVTAIRDVTETRTIIVDAESYEQSLDLARSKFKEDEANLSWSVNEHAVNQVFYSSDELKDPPIGAECLVQLADHTTSWVYVSFGSFTEHHQHDGYGVEDDHIFYYASDGEKELKQMMKDPVEGFLVIKYDLTYVWPTQNYYSNNGQLTARRYRITISNIETGVSKVLVESASMNQAKSEAISKLSVFDFSEC